MSAEAESESAEEPAVPTFEATIDVGTLSTFIEHIGALADEATFELDEDGISVNAVDPAAVAMLNNAALDEGAFESYTGAGRIGVNLSRLLDCLGYVDETVRLYLDPETMKLAIEDVAGRYSYDMALIDPDQIREHDDPGLELPSHFTIAAEYVDEAAGAADMVSDHIKLRMGGGEFVVEASGDTDDVRFEFGDDDLHDVEPADEAVESLFSLEYIQPVMGVVSGDVRINLGEEMPVVIEFDAADGYLGGEYAIAPRISSQ